LRGADKTKIVVPRSHTRLAGKGGQVYMLAQASIAWTIIVRVGSGVFAVKPYYKTSNYSMRNSVGYLMRICTNRLLPQMEALFQDQELTFSQWTTLVALHDGRISTAGEVAHNICHDAGSLTRLIDQMVERGLVARGRSDTDRRVVTLALTAPGRKLVEALAPKVMNFWNGLLAGFSHEEVDTLINLLTRLVMVAEGKPGRNRQPISDHPIAKSSPRSPLKLPVTNAKRRTS
jgi:DNA-binding MarR family transcriptional regulator